MKSLWVPLLISIAAVSLIFVFFEGIEGHFREALESAQSKVKMYALLSFGILVSDILLPVPSSIILYLNGWVLGLWNGFFLSYLALQISACLGYILGMKTSFGKPQSFEKSKHWIEKYGFLAILVSRGIPILSESISYTAGFNKMRWRTFLISNLIGYVPVCLLFSYFGSLGQNENAFLWSFGASMFLAAGFWLFGKSFLSNRSHD